MVTHPLVFVPGFPGSHLQKAATGEFVFLNTGDLLFDRKNVLPFLAGPDDLSDRSIIPAHPIRNVRLLILDLAKQAQSLYDILRSIGYETIEPNSLFRALGWDWRKPVDDQLAKSSLRSVILDLEDASGRRPVVLVHSTGGLVLRALLEDQPSLAEHLERVIAFGVPWGGTLRTLPLLTGDQGFANVPPDEAQQVIARSWAAFDLLPSRIANDSLGITLDGNGNPISLASERSWFPDSLTDVMNLRADRSAALHEAWTPQLNLGGRELAITNVVGFGAATLLRSRLTPNGTVPSLEEAKDDRSLDDGDGTVPRRSAAWLDGPGVRTFELPIGHYPGLSLASFHNTLWSNPGGQDLLWHFLADEPWLPFIHLALDGEDVHGFAENLRVRACFLSREGVPLDDVQVRFSGLTGGAEADRVASVGGRALFTMPRAAIRETTDGRFRRLTVEVSWSDGEIEPRSFLIPR